MIPETYKEIPQYGCAAGTIQVDGKPVLVTTPMYRDGTPDHDNWGEPYAGDTIKEDEAFLAAINSALGTNFQPNCLC